MTRCEFGRLTVLEKKKGTRDFRLRGQVKCAVAGCSRCGRSLLLFARDYLKTGDSVPEPVSSYLADRLGRAVDGCPKDAATAMRIKRKGRGAPVDPTADARQFNIARAVHFLTSQGWTEHDARREVQGLLDSLPELLDGHHNEVRRAVQAHRDTLLEPLPDGRLALHAGWEDFQGILAPLVRIQRAKIAKETTELRAEIAKIEGEKAVLEAEKAVIEAELAELLKETRQ